MSNISKKCAIFFEILHIKKMHVFVSRVDEAFDDID